jgi:hypothetical protein
MEDKKYQCNCKIMSDLPTDVVIAMAYVPFQTELVTYTNSEALSNGTLFPELDKKFYGGKCCG